jgi:hypothetical protein
MKHKSTLLEHHPAIMARIAPVIVESMPITQQGNRCQKNFFSDVQNAWKRFLSNFKHQLTGTAFGQ